MDDVTNPFERRHAKYFVFVVALLVLLLGAVDPVAASGGGIDWGGLETILHKALEWLFSNVIG